MNVGEIAAGIGAGLGVTAVYGGIAAGGGLVEGVIGGIVREDGQKAGRTWEDRLGNALLKNATRGVVATIGAGLLGTALGALAGPEAAVAGAMIGSTMGMIGGSAWGLIEGATHTDQKDLGLIFW